MNQPADFTIESRDQGETAGLTGDWTAVRMGWANERLGEALEGTRGILIDATDINRCDTSGDEFDCLDGDLQATLLSRLQFGLKIFC